MTSAEYFSTPETVLPRELAYGVLRVADAPTTNHQRVVRDVTVALHAYSSSRRLGEVLPAPIDVILDYDEALIVQPDIVFVSSGRSHIIGDRLAGAPDLVVEVLSPHPRIGQLEERIGWFATYGVRECWLLDMPRRDVVVLRCAAGSVVERRRVAHGELIESHVLPGVPLRPDDVFVLR